MRIFMMTAQRLSNIWYLLGVYHAKLYSEVMFTLLFYFFSVYSY